VPIPAQLAGRYAIERELGSGGMATVYLARDTRHDRQVAVKVMRPDLAASLGAERFAREIAIAASLAHPHIVPLHDSGVADGIVYYVMPFIEGESLRDRMARGRQLPVDEALRLACEVADALAYAHARGLVHRDIKPENVLLTGGHALVADFGIARAVSLAEDRRLTESGMAVGTPAYMSPEQAFADPGIDGRTDQYSLACVLYEMLAGEPPYMAPTAQAIIARRLADPMPSLRAAREAVPEHVERAIRRALAREPADRFPSAAAFADALRRPAEDAGPRSVAVLPFASLSADPENEYFADGITEDVIAQLAKIRALQVISRTSVMPFKGQQHNLREIAARLQVATILEGSVRRAGDRVRIVAQLIDARTDQHLWAETYDRHLTDIFAIQSEVALHIAGALQAELSPGEQDRIGREPTKDLRAYRLFLQGRRCFILYTPEAMREAIGFYEQAIAADPHYALAHAAIAYALTESLEIGAIRPEEGFERARTAAARALALDPELGEAHCVNALGHMYVFEWAEAEAAFRRALDLSPGNADAHDLYGRLCSAQRRWDEAIALQLRAQQLDPLAHPADVANAYLRAGRHEEALEAARRALALAPDYPRSHSTLGWVFLLTGRAADGVAELERAVALAPTDTMWLAQLGEACGLAGNADRAREIHGELERRATTRYVSPYHLAYVLTGLGEHDRAMDHLERAFAAHDGAVYGINGSFLFEPLRSHPRFIALLRRMDLA